tara:strand:- start:2036 stop:2176 length:141 start_codon:yes stop_codon:yes gene_type:complete
MRYSYDWTLGDNMGWEEVLKKKPKKPKEDKDDKEKKRRRSAFTQVD